MATAATKAISANSQVEGSAICNVDKKGNVQKVSGKTVDAEDGFADFNTKWANRSMGNDGLVT